MANLGSDNTPVEGESFGLPSGYSFDEENGDLVIRDTDGTVAMRRADGTWELESELALNENDISGVGAFDSESVSTEAASVAQSGTVISSNSTQSDVPSGTFAEIEFDTVEEDNLDAADLANNRITIQEDGDYLLHVFAEWEEDDAWTTGDEAGFTLAINGGFVGRALYKKVGDGSQSVNSAVIYRKLEQGDNITGLGRHTIDGADTASIRDRQRELTVVKVG